MDAERFIKDALIKEAKRDRMKKFIELVDYSKMAKIMEDYHQNQLNLLRIGDVSKQRELLIAFLFDFVGGDEQAPIEEWADSFLDRNKGNL